MFNQEWEIKPRATSCKMCQKPFNNGQVYISSLMAAAQGYERADCCEPCWKQAANNNVRQTTPEKDGHDGAWPSTSQENNMIPTVEGRAPRFAEATQGKPSRATPRSEPSLRSTSPQNSSQPDTAPGQPVLPKVGKAFSVWRGTFHAELPPPEVLKKETAESLLRKLIEKNDPHFRNAIFILAVMLERKRLLAEREVRKSEDEATIRVYEHRQTGETFIITDPMLNLNQIGLVQEEIATFLSGQEAIHTNGHFDQD